MPNKSPNKLTKLSGAQLSALCIKNPSDPIYRVRLAEFYLKNGNVVRGIYSARLGHALYLKEQNKIQLKSIIQKFGPFANSEKSKHLTSNAFIRIANEIGVISKRIKRVTLSEGEILFEAGEPIDYVYLVIEGELNIYDKVSNTQAMSLTTGEGSLIYEYDMNPDRIQVGELELGEGNVEYPTKTKTYRGSKVLVEEGSNEVAKKPKMYRGQIVAEPEKESLTQQTPTSSSTSSYRGAAISNLKGVHRYASVSANSKCVLLKFTAPEIEKELQKYEKLYDLALEESSTRFKFSRVTVLKLFSSLPVDLRYIIAGLATVVVHNEGNIINNEDVQNTLHFISQGHMQVYQESGSDELEYIGRLNQGDVIGLAPLLAEKQMNFIYQAEQGCEILELSSVVLKDIMALSKKFKMLLRTSYAKMVADFI